MMRKIFALALLSLSLAACEPATDNSNANKPNSNTPVVATPAPASSTPEAVASVKPQVRSWYSQRRSLLLNSALPSAQKID